MGDVVACPSCTRRNRVPVAASGTPACGSCHAPLPWVVDATDGDFDQAIAAPVPVVVDLWASWCGPCRLVTPVLEDLARERAGQVKVVKVDVDACPAIATRYQVQGIPTLLLIDHGQLAGRQTGALGAHALAQWLDEHTNRRRPTRPSSGAAR